MADLNQRILSIQSHVVSGYVGNKSATFPLQVLGFEVDSINSVQFSNHTGYGFWKGQVLNAYELGDLMEGLQKNNIDHYSHLLTGYIGSDSFLWKICDVVKDLKTVNPEIIYVCDPVMGDNGQMYVPSELLPIYREEIIPLADIITPNQYEAELLTETTIKTEADALKVMDILHSKGVVTVVLSSTDLGSANKLLCIASRVSVGKKMTMKIEIPKIEATFTGTGDLFTALLLAWLWKTKNNLKEALEKTVGTMHVVLQKTLEHAQEKAGPGKKPRSDQIELKLVQSRKEIENPDVLIEATYL